VAVRLAAKIGVPPCKRGVVQQRSTATSTHYRWPRQPITHRPTWD